MKKTLRLACLAIVLWPAFALGAGESEGGAATEGSKPRPASAGLGWILPAARDVELGGSLGKAYRRGVARLDEDPYRSAVYLRSDLSFEMQRSFTNYSGDISGRFLEIASLTSPQGKASPKTLDELLQTVAGYQKPDGHFGREVDWRKPIDDPPDNTDSGKAVRTPILWGNSRLLVGLLEAHAAFGRPDLLKAAKRLGDFYVDTAGVLLDPAREAQYRSTGSYAAAYVTDYFPAIEGLVRLCQATGDDRYLRHAERMADFFQRFDRLPIDHSHGNLIAYHGLVLLHEATGKREYLQRALDRWKDAVEGGYVWPTGGVGEMFRVSCGTDEGCSEADWLRLNLDLWRITGQARFLDAAERLLCNHFAMNRAANGGYGHRGFAGDAEGPLLVQPKFTEAVWCCTFHGLLGMHTLKSYVVAGSDRGVFVNFPFEVSAPVRALGGVWQASLRRGTVTERSFECRVRIDPQGAAAGPPPVFLRRPDWAEQVAVRDAAGHTIEAACESGYLRLPLRPGPAGELTVRFAFAPRVENRRMRPIVADPSKTNRLRGVVLGNGPHVLMALSDRPRPALVLAAGRDGRPRLPKAKDDGKVFRAVAVSGVDASDEQVLEAARAACPVPLAPWGGLDRTRTAAFVFDVILVPADSPAGKALENVAGDPG